VAHILTALAIALAALPGPAPGSLLSVLPGSRTQLVADLDRAQAIIDDQASQPAAIRSAGEFEQLATVELAGRPLRAQNATLALLGRTARAEMAANLSAARALSRLEAQPRRLPPWRIIQPPAPATLLAYFHLAQRRFGVRWQYLAAIELVETKFGRVRGTSSAGAQGPMQFLPSTWAIYGSGNIDNPRDAILAAARYLVASGAPADMTGALYHYNPSLDYVHAVQDYAARIRTDPRAYYGYYYWQVVFRRLRGDVILPVGYPKARPVPIRSRGVRAGARAVGIRAAGIRPTAAPATGVRAAKPG
jgi:hypothetical protein